MSEKLVVEFYQDSAERPLAAVLAFHGGDDPASGSLTLAAFLTTVRHENPISAPSAGELAAQFILWSTRSAYDVQASLRMDAILIQPANEYIGQVIQLRVQGVAVEVVIVTDQYSTEDELEEAASILSATGIAFRIQEQVATSA